MIFPLGVMADLHWICTHPGRTALAVSAMQCPWRFNWEMKTHRSTIPSPGAWTGHKGKRTQTDHQYSFSFFFFFFLKVALRTNCLTHSLTTTAGVAFTAFPFQSRWAAPSDSEPNVLALSLSWFCHDNEQRNNIGHLFGVQTCTFFRPASGVRKRKRWDGKEDWDFIAHSVDFTII